MLLGLNVPPVSKGKRAGIRTCGKLQHPPAFSSLFPFNSPQERALLAYRGDIPFPAVQEEAAGPGTADDEAPEALEAGE